MVTGIEVTFTFWLEFEPSSVKSAKTAFCTPLLTEGTVVSETPSIDEAALVPVVVKNGVPAVNSYVLPDTALEDTLQRREIVTALEPTASGWSKVNVLVPLTSALTWLLPVFKGVLLVLNSWQSERFVGWPPPALESVIGTDVTEYAAPLVPSSVKVPSITPVDPALGDEVTGVEETVTVLEVCADATPADSASKRSATALTILFFVIVISYK